MLVPSRLLPCVLLSRGALFQLFLLSYFGGGGKDRESRNYFKIIIVALSHRLSAFTGIIYKNDCKPNRMVATVQVKLGSAKYKNYILD